MKHRHIINLLWIALPICVLLRVIQLAFTIDGTTGFIKQQYNQISVLITFVVFATVVAMCVLAYFIENITCKKTQVQPVIALTCVLLGGMYIYETVTCFSTLNSMYSVLLLFLSLLSAFVFLAYGLEKIQPYNFPTITLVVPTIYYIVKLINLFISTSALSLVTENIFLLFTNSALLWFTFELASFENNFGNVKNSPKKLFACGIATTMLCVVTALPKLLLIFSQNSQISRQDISSSALMLAQAAFILPYIISNFCKKESLPSKYSSKHSL